MAKSRRILSVKDGEWVSIALEDEIFISGFDPKSSLGSAVVLPVETWEAKKLHAALESLAQNLLVPAIQLQLKAIVPSACLAEFQSLAQSANIRFEKIVEKTDPILDLLFYPKQGRTRLAKHEEHIPLPPSGPKKIRALIVDDSDTIRKILTKVLSEDPEIEVVGAASKPSEVEPLIRQHRPDVITLDIHMPEMDGVELLKRLMPRFRIPTIMITSISKEEGPKVFEALEVGAVDYIQKPSFDKLSVVTPIIVEKVKTAARAQLTMRSISAPPKRIVSDIHMDPTRFIAIGSSTGGTEALREVLIRMPEQIPPIVIVQHIPPVFSQAFAHRLDGLCPFEVKEAQDGDEVLPNRVLIAPGGTQMKIVKKSGGFAVVIFDGPPVNRHKPSVDVLFDSVAELMGRRATGVILTGMGADGARGLLKMRSAGSHTIAQDEASCVVFGMPREAIKLGAACEITSLLDIPQSLVKNLTQKKAA